MSIVPGSVLVSDTQIGATVSIASNAPNQTAPVQVQSQGYCGSGFVPANGNSSIAASSAQVVAAPGPPPSIFLYGTTNITNQTTTMYSGQQIALSATVNLPQGVTISSQQWSMPQGTAIGGYTNASGATPCLLATNCPQPDKSGGQVLSAPSNTGSSYTFYWVDAGSSRLITYTYTASNGATNSATTTFDVNGPTGAAVDAPTGLVALLPGSPPTMAFGGSPQNLGVQFTVSATPPSGNSDTYSWAQLISKNSFALQTNTGPLYCHSQNFDVDPNPALDNVYPYAISNYTDDNPSNGLRSDFGEVARSFSAAMYALWTPSADTRCPSANACTIAIPLGYVSWHFTGDAINTLQTQPSLIMYVLNSQTKTPSPAPFTSTSSYPAWTQTLVNTTPTQQGTLLTCQANP